jgi:hypothetical protein
MYNMLDGKVLQFEMEELLLYPSWIDNFMTRNGFKIVDKFGDFNKEAFDLQKSSRQILVCQKIPNNLVTKI